MNITPLLAGWQYCPRHIRQQGKDWYSLAHDACTTLAETHQVSLATACGVTSALSPALSWDVNLTWTARVLEHAQQYKTLKPSLLSGYQGYSTALKKAFTIAKGEIASHSAFSEQTAPKTRSFFFNLLEPDNPWPVTIDRHAASALAGLPATKPIALASSVYNKAAEAYRAAAAELGILGNQLQAAIWIMQRNRWQTTLPF